MSKLLRQVLKKNHEEKRYYVPTRTTVGRQPIMNRVPEMTKLTRPKQEQKREPKQKMTDMPSNAFVIRDLKDKLKRRKQMSRQKSNAIIDLQEEVEKFGKYDKNLMFLFEKIDSEKIFDIHEFERIRSLNNMTEDDVPVSYFFNSMKFFTQVIIKAKGLESIAASCYNGIKLQFPNSSLDDVLFGSQNKNFDKETFAKYLLGLLNISTESYQEVVDDLTFTADELNLDKKTKSLLESLGLYAERSYQENAIVSKQEFYNFGILGGMKKTRIGLSRRQRWGGVLILLVFIIGLIMNYANENQTSTSSAVFRKSQDPRLPVVSSSSSGQIVEDIQLPAQPFNIDTYPYNAEIVKTITNKNNLVKIWQELSKKPFTADSDFTRDYDENSEKASETIKKGEQFTIRDDESIRSSIVSRGEPVIPKKITLQPTEDNRAAIVFTETTRIQKCIRKAFRKAIEQNINHYTKEVDRGIIQLFISKFLAVPNINRNSLQGFVESFAETFSLFPYRYDEYAVKGSKKFEQREDNTTLARLYKADNYKVIIEESLPRESTQIFSMIHEFVFGVFFPEIFTSLGVSSAIVPLVILLFKRYNFKNEGFGRIGKFRGDEMILSVRSNHAIGTKTTNNGNPFDIIPFEDNEEDKNQVLTGMSKYDAMPFTFVANGTEHGIILPIPRDYKDDTEFCLIFNNEEPSIVRKRILQTTDKFSNYQRLISIFSLAAKAYVEYSNENPNIQNRALFTIYTGLVSLLYKKSFGDVVETDGSTLSSWNKTIMYFDPKKSVMKNIKDYKDYNGQKCTTWFENNEGPITRIEELYKIIQEKEGIYSYDGHYWDHIVPLYLAIMSADPDCLNEDGSDIKSVVEERPIERSGRRSRGRSVGRSRRRGGVNEDLYDLYEKIKKLQFFDTNIIINNASNLKSLELKNNGNNLDQTIKKCRSYFTDFMSADQNIGFLFKSREDLSSDLNTVDDWKNTVSVLDFIRDNKIQCFFNPEEHFRSKRTKMYFMFQQGGNSKYDKIHRACFLYRSNSENVEHAAAVIYPDPNLFFPENDVNAFQKSNEYSSLAYFLMFVLSTGVAIVNVNVNPFNNYTEKPGEGVNASAADNIRTKLKILRSRDNVENAKKYMERHGIRKSFTDAQKEELRKFMNSMDSATRSQHAAFLKLLGINLDLEEGVIPFIGEKSRFIQKYEAVYTLLKKTDNPSLSVRIFAAAAHASLKSAQLSDNEIEEELKKIEETIANNDSSFRKFNVSYSPKQLQDNTAGQTYRVNSVRQDGLCLFHCLCRTVYIGMSAEELRSYTLSFLEQNRSLYDDKIVNTEIERLRSNDVINPENFPTEVSINALARMAKINIKVYVDIDERVVNGLVIDGQYIREYNFGQGDISLLNWSNVHFEYLTLDTAESPEIEEVDFKKNDPTRVLF